MKGIDLSDAVNSENTFISSKDLEKLAKTYKSAQDKIWDGDKVLDELINKHGLPNIDSNKKEALIRVLTLIRWGEMAAWLTSSHILDSVHDPAARLAVTAQIHDESRHFKTISRYMNDVLGDIGSEPASAAVKGLQSVNTTRSVPNMLLGMQLMVEPVAITLFRSLRRANVEPILIDLLAYFERDESRHIAIGVIYLPEVIRKMSWIEIARMLAWQANLLRLEIDGLQAMSADLKVIGIDPRTLLNHAERRQIEAIDEMIEVLGWGDFIPNTAKKVVDIYVKLTWPN